MKNKIIPFIIGILMFMMLPKEILAASGSAYLNGKESLVPGETANFTLGFNGTSKVTGAEYRIEVSGDLEITNITKLNDTSISGYDGKVISQREIKIVHVILSNGLDSGSAWANVAVRVPDSAKAGSGGTIKISQIGLSLADNPNTVSASEVLKNITVTEPVVVAPQVGQNNRQPEPEPVVAKQTSAKLKELAFNNVEIEDFVFDPNVFEYSIQVAHDITGLEVAAIPEEEGALVEVAGNADFIIGENIVTVKVTSSDQTSNTYTIKVTVLDEDGEVTSNKRNEDNCPPCNREQIKDNAKLVWIVISISLAIALILETAYIIIEKKKKPF